MTPQRDETAGDGFAETARQRAIEAYEQARENVGDAGRKAKDTLTEAPLLALAGGIAAGALLAALLPRTEKETELVRPAAKRVKDTARAAVQAARETGTQKLDELGLNREKGSETLRSLLQNVGDAVKASADAALDSTRKG